MNQQTQSVTVHRIDKSNNLFLFNETLQPDPDGQIHVPGNCVQVEMPEAPVGQWQRWVSDVPTTNFRFGLPGTGSWEVIPDYRKTDLYLTSDGTKYSLDKEHEINGTQESYPGYGYLPTWLTTEPRPSQFHNWIGNEWVLDQEAFDANAEAIERGWRDGEISRITWLRDRHLDEVAQDLETTLSEAQYTELLTYIQQLRDWPAQPEFPQQASRPEKPDWL